MARSVNMAVLIGNMTKDAEVRYTGAGKAVATFGLATSESWKDADGNKQERTEFHNIVAWSKLAEIVGEYGKKGMKVYVKGRIQYRTYDDKQGIKHYVTEVVADEFLMLDSRKPEEVASPATPSAKDDDLPFSGAGRGE